MSRRADLFAAVRPFAPNQNFSQADVGVLDGLADRWGIAREGAAPAAVVDPEAFFAAVRRQFGALDQGQVDGFNTLLAALKGWPVSWIAYALATAWHETARTMQPIKELGGEAYFRRRYDIEGDKPDLARRLGNLKPGDGARYAGRGYVQLTGRTNYERYGLADRPDDAMKPDVAAAILRDGMEHGRFTAKKLGDYLPGDYVEARRIINGTDRASQIAGYARAFETALTA